MLKLPIEPFYTLLSTPEGVVRPPIEKFNIHGILILMVSMFVSENHFGIFQGA
jgi:hypothetical protein